MQLYLAADEQAVCILHGEVNPRLARIMFASDITTAAASPAIP
jgi:hypothetical protein